MTTCNEAPVSRDDLENLVRRRAALEAALRESNSIGRIWELLQLLVPMYRLHRVWCLCFTSQLPGSVDPELLRAGVRSLRSPSCLHNEGSWSAEEGNRYAAVSAALDPVHEFIERLNRAEAEKIRAARPRPANRARQPDTPELIRQPDSRNYAEKARDVALRMDKAAHLFLERKWRASEASASVSRPEVPNAHDANCGR